MEPRLGQREGLGLAGDVPVQGRGVVLDVSRLRPGRYRVEISVARAGTASATSRRDIVIQR